MFVPFESLPGSSRVWIYQANREIKSNENKILEEYLQDFITQWAAHGKPIKASFQIVRNYFVIIAADEGFNEASGCSIDASFNALKAIQQKLDLDFFDRNLVAFKSNKDEIMLLPISSLKEKYKEKVWDENSLVFNNQAETIDGLLNHWIIPTSNSWLKRYVPKENLAPGIK